MSCSSLDEKQHVSLLCSSSCTPCVSVERSALAKTDRISIRCVGSENCCTHRTGTVWGSGPFTTDSPICQCAVFAGLIDSVRGGLFEAKSLGVLTEFNGGVRLLDC